MNQPSNSTNQFPRRRVITLIAGAAGAALLAACSDDNGAATPSTSGAASTPTSGAASTPTSGAGAAECAADIPQETAGPFPGDGSNGPDALTDPAAVREDITGSFGAYSGTAEGVPTTLHLTVLAGTSGCTPLRGAAVYAWHADRDGRYSMYTAQEANYLRGVGETDDSGTVTFRTVFPGCYDGRWPHVHFEVYPSLADAQAASNLIVTSQLALPQDACQAAYAADGYASSASALSRTSLERDMVFRDGAEQQLATVIGSAADGFEVSLAFTVRP
ncbi:MAG: hypothetical protein RI900_1958 [Actinomycetota bacterium]